MKPSLIAVALFTLVFGAPAVEIARAAQPEDPSASAPPVYTRALVQSISTGEGKSLYIRLKLIPRAKIPFSTLTYRVLDPGLVTGLRDGDSVAFKADRRDGENVLTAIHKVAPCERFKECK